MIRKCWSGPCGGLTNHLFACKVRLSEDRMAPRAGAFQAPVRLLAWWLFPRKDAGAVNSGVSRRLIVTAALAAGLGLVAVGCSAGQVTQTDTQVAAVDGASGNAGPIAVRNVMLAFPPDGNRYHEGDDVPLTFVIANTGRKPGQAALDQDRGRRRARPRCSAARTSRRGYALQAEYDASKAPTKTSAPSSGSHAPSVVMAPRHDLRRSSVSRRPAPGCRRPRRSPRRRAR